MSEKPLVLIADDHPDIREGCADALELAGFRVATASDGVEACEKAQAEHPDIVLLDLSMPLMDGIEATKMLKRDDRTAQIPVAIVTGHVGDSRSNEAARSGCDMMITKPCLPPDLEHRIRALLSRRRPEEQAPDETEGERTELE